MQAYAAARFAESVLLGLNGEKDIVECTYVESSVVPGFAYFSSQVRGAARGLRWRGRPPGESGGGAYAWLVCDVPRPPALCRCA